MEYLQKLPQRFNYLTVSMFILRFRSLGHHSKRFTVQLCHSFINTHIHTVHVCDTFLSAAHRPGFSVLPKDCLTHRSWGSNHWLSCWWTTRSNTKAYKTWIRGTSLQQNIHPAIIYIAYPLGSWGSWGQSHLVLTFRPMVNLESPHNLTPTFMSLDCGRKPEPLEKCESLETDMVVIDVVVTNKWNWKIPLFITFKTDMW